MLIKTVDINEAQWTKLLSMVKTGTEIILMEGSTFIARLVPVSSSTSSRLPDLHSGAIWTSDDFDQPLPDEFWMAEV
jgi:antitoxin (DNA-binding transcriptional repressor) of toxin-antitoxin stability system